jgi:hypothetical protein
VVPCPPLYTDSQLPISRVVGNLKIHMDGYRVYQARPDCEGRLSYRPILELGFRMGDSITPVRQQFPCKEVFQKLLYSSLPPTTVHTTYTSFTLFGSIVNMSPERSTKSAYLPGTREPRFPSTKLAHAPLIV